MKRHAPILVLSMLLGMPSLRIQAQAPALPLAHGYLDVNHVKARINNSGTQFFDGVGTPQYIVPYSPTMPAADYRSAQLVKGLWMGAYDNTNTLRVAAATYGQSGTDYYTGPVRQGHPYDSGVEFSIPAPLHLMGAVPIDGGKHMLTYDGGYTVHDPATRSAITLLTPLPRQHLQAAYLPDGRTLLFGDDQLSAPQPCYIVDPAQNYLAQPGPTLLYVHRNSVAQILNNGKVLLAGLFGCELYDPATNSSTAAAPMPVPVSGAGHTLLSDGRVLLVGGSHNIGTTPTRRDIQIYDPATDTWTLGPQITLQLFNPVVAQLPNGRVSIAGGFSTTVIVVSYDLSTNTASLLTIRQTLSFTNRTRGTFIPGTGLLLGMEGGQLEQADPSTAAFSDIGLRMLEGGQLYTLSSAEAMVEVAPMEWARVNVATRGMPDMPYQKIWKVSKAQINQFLQDRASNSVNFANYPDIQTWPAHGDPSKGEDVHLAPFVDVNNDGLYRPFTQGDYPCIMGDQALWWVFHDQGTHGESGGTPLDVQVKAMAYAYDCNLTPCPDSSIGYSTFYHYEVTNKGTKDLNDLRLGLFHDFDLGNYSDDYVGTDSALNLTYVYNGDANDESAAGYGLYPPAQGAVMLGQPLGTSMFYQNDFSNAGNPVAAIDYHKYLNALWLDGQPITYPGSSAVTQMYTGDPGLCRGNSPGWTMLYPGMVPWDERAVQSAAAVTLPVGATQNLDVAMVWARAYTNDNLGSICALRQAAAAVTAFWDATPKGCFNMIVARPEAAPASVEIRLLPNPASTQVEVLATGLNRGGRITVCDLSGRVLMAEGIAAGTGQATLDVRNLSAGVYLLKVEAGDVQGVRRLVVAR